MLQRLRVAVVRAERAPLAGDVEVDETFVGGVRSGAKRGRQVRRRHRRFDRRTSRSRGLVFRRLLEQAVTTGPVTEDELAGGYTWKLQDAVAEEQIGYPME